jgi:hypothetical protein
MVKAIPAELLAAEERGKLEGKIELAKTMIPKMPLKML